MARLAAAILSVAIVSTGLGIVAAPFCASVAMAQTVTRAADDIEVLIRMIGKTDPESATKIREGLDEIDKSELSPEDKSDAKERLIDKVARKLEKLYRSPLVGAAGRANLIKNARIARALSRVIYRQHRQLAGVAYEPVRPADFGNDEEISAGFIVEFLETSIFLEEQRRREAQLDKPDLPPAEPAPPGSGFDEGKQSSSGFSATIGFGIAERKPKPQVYLAREFGGVLDLGVVAQNRDTEITSWDAALRYAGEFSDFTNAAAGNDYVFDLYIRNLSGSSRLALGGGFDTDGGGLGIPGVGDGIFPAGIFLANPAFNDVTGISGNYDYESWESGVRFAGFGTQLTEMLAFTPLFGASYISTKEDQSFGGRVDGFLIDFRYNTRLHQETVKVEVGARFDYELSSTLGFFVEPTASLNFIDIKGWDGLEISGFVNDSQLVDLDGRETLPGAKLAVGFDWKPEKTPFSIYLGAHIAHEPDSVSVFRSGETGAKSEPNVEYSKSYGLGASLNIKL